MKLAQFIETEMETLLENWEEAALQIAPEFEGEDSRFLRDHAAAMLEFITNDLLTSETSQESASKAQGQSKTPVSGAGGGHGSGRLEQGLSILQLVQELRALRARIIKGWSDENQGLTTNDINELVRFNEAIDQLIVESISSYSARKDQETRLFDQVWRNANFDALTDIPNRRLFLDRLEQNLLEAERKDNSFALLFIDLDRFKQTNDRLGHNAGDCLLKQVAGRISTNIRAMDTVARLGGDEFTVILTDTNSEDAMRIARVLLASLAREFDVGRERVHISGTIGLTLFPEDATDTATLLHNADQAMYVAKEHAGQQIQTYQSWMAQSESEHMRLNRELDDAFRDDQLEVYYQPIIDIRTGAISRAEALLRWNHPDKGLQAPAAFLTVAEQSGLMDSINAFVLEQAVTCSFEWRNKSGDPLPININGSISSFFTKTLADQWRAWMTESDLKGSRITIELNPASLAHIRSSGFNPVKSFGLAGLRLPLSIDDFGIEPFSLLALQEFQVDSVKVDTELIKDAGQDGHTDRILKAIIGMAHAINIEVVAEGVETDEQLQFLSRSGCDYAQGFLFSSPLRKDDFEALLERNRQ